MARCSAAFRPSGAGSTTLPMASLYATAAVRPVLREVGVFNTTATAVAVCLKRATTTGTQGAGQTEVAEDDESHTVLGAVFDVHTVGPTLGAAVRQASLGAAIGSGVIWTFGGQGLIIPAATTNGVAIVAAVGTSQVCDVTLVWDE